MKNILVTGFGRIIEDVKIITLDRPHRKNAIGKNMIKELQDVINELKKLDARAVVVHSAIENVFSAGADLHERLEMNENEVVAFVTLLRETFTQLEELKMPTIACINGTALGGGLELALACDLRIARKEAKMGLPETNLAIIPGAGGTQRLSRLIGTAKAKELIFLGKILDGRRAADIGLVNEFVEGDVFEKGLLIGPIAIRAAKAAIAEAANVDINTGLKIEGHCYEKTVPTEDRLEGLKSFQESRSPQYTGK
ncbi:ClpP/crotonase [Rozella allomycis CSF55]|uniref:ClpP/crotonase n=1 Tax=Rozella allomycis (strain CSF55) TaxID=988480 RepID=A0A075AP30_ROZAC|nr:Enoyl-CoA hydratase/isomerase domain-containing protein [Rozella allomycis CSF55]RKP16739.1 ClpP/crotonase [Rozella allomycis CSF55]|eukprot:EPZ31757.1 Enoyl-CoA hydratase/isomerase domain-containing protein [Rozella allomycis CSF55]